MPSEFGRATAPDTLRLERTFRAPLERVWQYLVDPDKRATWFAGGSIEPRVGGTAALWFDHRNLSTEPIPERYRGGADGQEHRGIVTAWEPPHRLAFTWGSGPEGSEVEFTLSPAETGTRLVIVHRRLSGPTEMADVGGGWHSHVGLLGDLLEDRTPREFWSRVREYEPQYVIRCGHPQAVPVRISRRFVASPERVFDAWLDPVMIGRWMFGPSLRDEQIVSLSVDAQVGGLFSFVVLRQGQRLDHQGEYLVLDRPRRLVFTWGVGEPNASRVQVDLHPDGAGTRLDLLHELPPAWADHAGRTGDGWARMSEALGHALAG